MEKYRAMEETKEILNLLMISAIVLLCFCSVATACGPACPPCHTWDGQDCDWNCSSGESCCDGSCYDTSKWQCCDQETGKMCPTPKEDYECCHDSYSCCAAHLCQSCIYTEGFGWWCPTCDGDLSQLCCEGEETCYDIETQDCCDELKIYDIATEKCCNEDTGHTCPKEKCCVDGQCINNGSECEVDRICCDGSCCYEGDCCVDGVCIGNGDECDSNSKCCNGECYDLEDQRCCDGKEIYDPNTEKCCNEDTGHTCPKSPVDKECCDGACCDPSQCCNNGTCVDKCTMTGQCSYTPPETSNYVECQNFNPTDKSCEEIIEGALCNHLVTVGLNEAECADCAPNCDKTRICACAEITPVFCKTNCFWDGIPPVSYTHLTLPTN